MNKDTIYRQAAIDAHCELCIDRDTCNCDICPDVEVFQLLPSAQPETMYYPQVDGVTPSVIVQPERKKGKWINLKNKKGTILALRCSVCGNSPKHAIRSDYCPNCGSYNGGEEHV